MSFGGTGIRDWLAQRLSAVVLFFYTIAIGWFFITHPKVTYAGWYAFFMNPIMKIATLVALLCIVLHAWIGIWTVLTDYVHKVFIRSLLELIVGVSLFVYLVWGIQILYQF